MYKCDKRLVFTQKIDKAVGDYIGTLVCKGEEYCVQVQEGLINPEKINNYDERLWIVIKSTMFKNGYRLREGDVIKLGKVMFKVRELKSDDKKNNGTILENKILRKEKTFAEGNNNVIEMNILPGGQNLGNQNNFSHKYQNINQNSQKNNLDPTIKKRKGNNNPQCRICLMDDNEPENPLINPCHCTGSVRFIHLLCIRQWLKSKIVSKNFNFLSVHSYKNLECELCKTPFPERIRFRSDILSLVDYAKPESNYLMLESLSREKRETRYLYIIHMQEKNEIKLGRSNDSDVRMTDISVSRNHAVLKLLHGDFYLEDNSSKFGTLVQIQNDITIIPNKQIAMQSGKLFLIFNTIKTCFAWVTCYKNKKLHKFDYNDLLENDSPCYYKEEIDSLHVVNTDYSMSFDGGSSKNIPKVNSRKGSMQTQTKEVVNVNVNVEQEKLDKFIFKQIEKDLKELKEEMKEGINCEKNNFDENENFENNIINDSQNSQNSQNENDYTGINYVNTNTINNKTQNENRSALKTDQNYNNDVRQGPGGYNNLPNNSFSQINGNYPMSENNLNLLASYSGNSFNQDQDHNLNHNDNHNHITGNNFEDENPEENNKLILLNKNQSKMNYFSHNVNNNQNLSKLEGYNLNENEFCSSPTLEDNLNMTGNLHRRSLPTMDKNGKNDMYNVTPIMREFSVFKRYRSSREFLKVNNDENSLKPEDEKEMEDLEIENKLVIIENKFKKASPFLNSAKGEKIEKVEKIEKINLENEIFLEKEKIIKTENDTFGVNNQNLIKNDDDDDLLNGLNHNNYNNHNNQINTKFYNEEIDLIDLNSNRERNKLAQEKKIVQEDLNNRNIINLKENDDLSTLHINDMNLINDINYRNDFKYINEINDFIQNSNDNNSNVILPIILPIKNNYHTEQLNPSNNLDLFDKFFEFTNFDNEISKDKDRDKDKDDFFEKMEEKEKINYTSENLIISVDKNNNKNIKIKKSPFELAEYDLNNLNFSPETEIEEKTKNKTENEKSDTENEKNENKNSLLPDHEEAMTEIDANALENLASHKSAFMNILTK
jgi:hypothetical protein